MTAPKVEIIGEDKVRRAFAGLEDDVEKVAEPSERLGRIGQETAQDRAPRRTGELEAGIEYRADDEGVELRTAVRHAPYQEFGTRYVIAQRFMRAGFEAMSERARDTYTDWLEGSLEKADRSA